MKQPKNSNKISTTEKKTYDYSKIGHHLKLVRERKGLSYEQIFEITRIQPSILKDIEEGKVSISPVFLKGFIKTYARFLGQDVEDLFKKEDKQEEDEKIKETDKSDKNKKRIYLKYLWPLPGLFIVLAVWMLNTPNKDSKENSIVLEDETPLLNQKATEDIKPKIQENTTMETQRENFTEIGETQKEDFPEENTTLFHQIKTSAFKQDLLIQSSEPLDIYFKLDKKSNMVTKTLQASTWFHIKAKESIYLRFDENRGQVQIFYNGKQVLFDNRPFFEKTFQ